MADLEHVKSVVLKNSKKYLLAFLLFIFPERMITTFFGLGYLPDWQNHWTAFFAIPFIALVTYFTVGFNASLIVITFVLLAISFIFCFSGMLAIYLFHKFHRYTKYEINIHIAFGQTFMIFLSVPAIVSFVNFIAHFNRTVCTQFLFCADWFFYTATYFAAMLVPYFIFRLVDILKPWPAYIIDRDYDRSDLYMLEGFTNALYAAFLIYLLAFLLLDLDMITVINFYNALLFYMLSFVI